MKVLNFYKIGKTVSEGQVYIGRTMPHLGLKQSIFANPFKISGDIDRDYVISQYRTWLHSQIISGGITKQDFLDLEGKDLVCFCKQENKEVACHGDVVLSAYNWAMNGGLDE